MVPSHLPACHWSVALETSAHEQPEVLLTLVVWQGREAAALEKSQWKAESKVPVTILLQHRGDTCSFPGFKGEDGKAPFQCWAFLPNVPLVLAFPTEQQSSSPAEHWVFPLWEMHSAGRSCNPTLCKRPSLARQAGSRLAAADSSSKASKLFCPHLKLLSITTLQPPCIPAPWLQQSKPWLLQSNPFDLEP